MTGDVALDRTHEPLLDATDELLIDSRAPEPTSDRGGAWAMLVRTLADVAVETDDGAERIALLSRCARLVDEHLDDAQASVEAWHRVLGVDAHHLVALRALVEASRRLHDPSALIGAVELLLDRGAAQLDEDEVHAIVRELSGLHIEAGNWDRATELAVRDLELTRDPVERRAVLRRLSTVAW